MQKHIIKFCALQKKLCCLLVLCWLSVSGCKTTQPFQSSQEASKPGESLPYKRSRLSREALKSWPHMDIWQDSIPGLSIIKAMAVVKGREAVPTVVAIIDSGIKTDHPLLASRIWKNGGEEPANQVDDDNNGYVDDVHGWNFLGGTVFSPYAITRIVAHGDRVFGEKDISRISPEDRKHYEQYLSLKPIYAAKVQKAAIDFDHSSKMMQRDEVNDPTIVFYKMAKWSYEYHYNKSFHPRTVIGDDPHDLQDRDYGNSEVQPQHEAEIHGTHVAGIVAGITQPFAADISLMPIRAVPHGDEYDKDIALAIRYAVDNGAKVINMSFGKSYSEHADWVYEAIAYAAEKDVLLVHAAGNDALNVDTVMVYPNDHKETEDEFSDNFINVGSIRRYYNKKLLSNTSNYGREHVDIFAPGADIFSSVTEDVWDYVSATDFGPYDFRDGTSMAAPMVSSVAALLRAYYPALTAAQVKQIILSSGLEVPFEVVVPGKVLEERPFATLCKSGRILNAYKALLMAEEMPK